jgi:hypothetical protein
MPHQVTERLFVVRRVFRLNDSLPDELAPRWQWQRGGWLLIDRTTGRVAAINLPDYDALYSAASWYALTLLIAGSLATERRSLPTWRS